MAAPDRSLLRLLLAALLAPATVHGARAQEAGPDPFFVEAGAGAGLDFVHFNGMSGELYLPEITGAGAGLLDYDGDGDLDLYLVQGAMLGPGKTTADATLPPRHAEPLSDRLYRNDLGLAADGGPEPRFVDVTEASGLDGATGYGMGVAAGDYDGDGDLDLYLTNLGPNQLWRNRGDGTFEEVTAASGAGERRWSIPAVFFDFDGDGRRDLYVGNYVDFLFARHRTCTAESGEPDYCGPLAYRPEPDRLLRNLGDGSFEDFTIRAGMADQTGSAMGVSAADFNGDGRIDLYVANDEVPNHLWINLGGGRFRDDGLLAGSAVNWQGQPEASMGVDAADFDGDGDEDLFMTHLTGESNTLYLNDGAGNFRDRTASTRLDAPSRPYTSFGTGWVDFDNDGWLDLLIFNGTVRVIPAQVRAGDPLPLRQRNQLFRNLGDGSFEDLSDRGGEAFRRLEVSRGAAFGDVDNDGDADVLLSNNGGPARLLNNRAADGAGWLGLRLVDAPGGADLVGSRAAVSIADRPPLWRRARTDGSYASTGDPRLTVGAAGAAAVVRVRWPGGRRGEWRGLPAGVYTTLPRDRGPAPGGSR